MDALISSALEEVCYRGTAGVSLSSLWSKLDPPPSPAVKACLWSNLVLIPTIQFVVQGKEAPFDPQDSRIQRVEDAEKLKLKIVAKEHLRDSFVGLYDVPSTGFNPLQRRALERLAIAREDGITQSELAKEFGMEGRHFFYVVKNLESRNLIVRQPAIVKTMEAGGAGEMKSCVRTNLMYLSRYAMHLDVQQRLEINKEERDLASADDIREAQVDEEDSYAGDRLKDDVLVKDYLPAMRAICDKLEGANGNVLVISDVKKNLGYVGRHGHRAWRLICQKLKEAGLVERFDAKVNEKVEHCIRLLKKLSPDGFETKVSGGSSACDGNKQLKFGRRPKINEQLLELPVNHQICDVIAAKGTEGATGIEVCSRLGLDKKKTYERFNDLISRFGMRCQAESHKKTAIYRYWTPASYNPQVSNPRVGKLEIQASKPRLGKLEIQASNPRVGKLETSAGLATSAFGPVLTEVPNQSAEISSTDNNVISGVNSTDLRHLTGGTMNTESSKFIDNGKTNSGKVPAINHTSKGTASSAGLDVQLNGASSETSQTILLKQPCSHQTPLTADSALREQRILERLQDEKIVLRVVLHNWLIDLEKHKGTTMGARTIKRILNKLQEEGRCRCVTFHVPSVTNCGRSRMTQVVLHPSIDSVLPEQVYDKLREFEKLSRQESYKCKAKGSIPVLSDVIRTEAPVDLDDQAAKLEAIRTNGFVLAKMVRAKLLYSVLWDFLRTLDGWDDILSSGLKVFSLQAAVKTIPLEVFLQVAGSTQKIDNLVEKCKLGLRLSDLPAEEYKSLMDTMASGRLSKIIDILRRLKLIRLIPVAHSEDGTMLPHAMFIDAMVLKPYIEEPPPIAARSLDLRPRYRHDFVLSSKEAVEDYWKTLEFCYAAADPKAAFHAFPGSAVPENIQEFGSYSPSGNCQNRAQDKRSESRKRLKRHKLQEKFMKCLSESSDAGRQLYKSVAVSNAVELLKLVFLSSSTTPDLQNMLGETLRHYSEHDLFAAFSYLRENRILIGGSGGPFVLSQQFLHNISRSPFPTNTGKRAVRFSNWLREGNNYSAGGSIDVKEDLHCGDIFQLFALVSYGEMSVSPCLPDEGLGEADDLRSSKRKAEDDGPCDRDKAKKMKSIADSETCSRREKGFPGIRVSICCATILPAGALDSLSDGKNNGIDISQKDKIDNGFVQKDVNVPECPDFGNVTPSAKLSSQSSWEAMAGYANYLHANASGPTEGSSFSSEVFMATYTAIHKSGDQGLGIEEVSQALAMAGVYTLLSLYTYIHTRILMTPLLRLWTGPFLYIFPFK
ncbi:hypothetical protein LINPERPRIM_LOCUS19417 [Linum perenne]